MLHCIVLAVSTFCNPLTTSGEGVVQKATFANPIDLQYRMRPEKKGYDFREGADPDVVMWDGRYWMFASKCGGYYVSDDLASWRLVHTDDLPLEEYAPTAWVMDNQLYFSSRGGTVHRAVDADAGKWELLKQRIPLTLDSKVFFEDGRLFDYYGGTTNKMPLWVSELDRSTFRRVGNALPITEMDDTLYGWDVCGHDNGFMGRLGCKEGSYIINRNGVYYFQYATPGTQYFSYCDVALAGPTPLGPFKRQALNPFSYKPNGYAKGAGHGCTFSDRYGNWWHVTTCVIKGVNRRIVMFPVFFAADGEMWCDTAFADWPLAVPGHKTDNPDEYHTGWMPLTYGKRVSVSSAPGPSTKFIVDEDMHTSWIAASGNAGEWAEVDLGGPAEIRSVQIGFAENGNIDAWRRRDAARRWRFEVSNDGKSWECAIDESNASGSPDHPYRAFGSPIRASRLRVVCAGLPGGNKFALREIRAFGRMDVPAPSAVESFTVERDVADRRRARLSWSAAKGADGYVVRYGPAPDKLLLSIMFRDVCKAEVRSLDVGQDYWWKIEAFNAFGFSPATHAKTTK